MRTISLRLLIDHVSEHKRLNMWTVNEYLYANSNKQRMKVYRFEVH